MSTALTAAVLSAGLLVCGCEASCPPVTLVAEFQPDGAAVTVHNVRTEPWQSLLSLAPASDNGKAWTAAVQSSSRAPASLGVIVFFSADGGETLTLGLPFPMTTGQNLALTANEQAGVSSFQLLPAAAGPTAWLDTCSGMSPTNCALTDGQTVTGTLRVEQASPLSLRIDADFSGGPGSSPAVVGGVVTFDPEPHGCPSGGSWGPRISG